MAHEPTETESSRAKAKTELHRRAKAGASIRGDADAELSDFPTWDAGVDIEWTARDELLKVEDDGGNTVRRTWSQWQRSYKQEKNEWDKQIMEPVWTKVGEEISHIKKVMDRDGNLLYREVDHDGEIDPTLVLAMLEVRAKDPALFQEG